MKQRAYDELKQMILSGKLAAGTVLSVRQLAVEMNMSKTPVHSAVERLETDGFVTLAPQQGVVVREVSPQDIVNQFEMRLALEPFVVRRLAGTLTPEQIDQLRQNLARHRSLCDAGELEKLILVDAEFHQLLCSFLGNDEITRAMQQLQDKVHRAIDRLVRHFPERVSESYDEHHAIFEALVSGDGDSAVALMNEHLDLGIQRFWRNRSTGMGPVETQTNGDSMDQEG
jgi:DNA-binding GntR family transcriptional regulator